MNSYEPFIGEFQNYTLGAFNDKTIFSTNKRDISKLRRSSANEYDIIDKYLKDKGSKKISPERVNSILKTYPPFKMDE